MRREEASLQVEIEAGYYIIIHYVITVRVRTRYETARRERPKGPDRVQQREKALLLESSPRAKTAKMPTKAEVRSYMVGLSKNEHDELQAEIAAGRWATRRQGRRCWLRQHRPAPSHLCHPPRPAARGGGAR